MKLHIMLGTAAMGLIFGSLISETAQAHTFPQQVNPHNCPVNAGGGQLVNYFETNNFKVYICYTSKGFFYTGINKKNGTHTIPLPAQEEEGTGFVVDNGNITYIVNGLELSIFRGNKLLQEEQVIRVISNPSFSP
ncbi:MAG: hypothetical protein KME08_01000 [Aphanothece sp. CMT-3BRIN-NPC111]|nr:hypothetical protein [Aphanothece sp. CMT-3BRIN-NPC111]